MGAGRVAFDCRAAAAAAAHLNFLPSFHILDLITLALRPATPHIKAQAEQSIEAPQQ